MISTCPIWSTLEKSKISLLYDKYLPLEVQAKKATKYEILYKQNTRMINKQESINQSIKLAVPG